MKRLTLLLSFLICFVSFNGAYGYDQTTWVDGSEPAINAENLNHIEAGIDANEDVLQGCAVDEMWMGGGVGSERECVTSFYVVDSTEVDQGLTGNGKTLKAFNDAIGAGTGTIYLPLGNYTLTTSETLNSGVTLKVDPGVVISLVGDLTFSNNNIIVGNQYWVDTTGGGSLLGNPNNDKIYPNWWTVNTTPGTTDMTTAIEAADTLAAGYSTVGFLPQTYKYTQLTPVQYARWEGSGREYTILQSTYAGNTVTLSHDIRIKGITFDGVSKVASSVGIYAGTVNRTIFEDVEVKRFETGELRQSGIFCVWYDVYYTSNTTGFKVFTDGSAGFNQNQFKGGKFTGNSGTGLHLEYDSHAIENNIFDGVDIESNDIGTKVLGVYSPKFTNCWWENNTTDHIQVNDVGTEYTTGMLVDSSVIGSLVGGGVSLQGLNNNFEVRNSFLDGHTWVINCSRWIQANNNYENSVTWTTTQNSVIRKAGTQTWAEQITLPGTSETSINHQQIVFDSTNFQQRFASVQTTDANATTLASVALTDEKSYLIEVRVLAQKSDGSERSAYHLEGLFYRDGGGGATQEGATTSISAIEGDAAMDCVFDTSGNNVRVRATGLAATFEWRALVKVIEL